MHSFRWLILSICALVVSACAGGGNGFGGSQKFLTNFTGTWATYLKPDGRCLAITSAVGQPGFELIFLTLSSGSSLAFTFPAQFERTLSGRRPVLVLESGDEFALTKSGPGRYALVDQEAVARAVEIMAIFDVSAVEWRGNTNLIAANHEYGRPFSYPARNLSGGVSNVAVRPKLQPNTMFRTSLAEDAVRSCYTTDGKRFTSGRDIAKFLQGVSRGTFELSGRNGGEVDATYENVRRRYLKQMESTAYQIKRARSPLYRAILAEWPRRRRAIADGSYYQEALNRGAAGLVIGTLIYLQLDPNHEFIQEVRRRYAQSSGGGERATAAAPTATQPRKAGDRKVPGVARIEPYGTNPKGDGPQYRITCTDGQRYRYWEQNGEWAGPNGTAGFRGQSIEALALNRCGDTTDLSTLLD